MSRYKGAQRGDTMYRSRLPLAKPSALFCLSQDGLGMIFRGFVGLVWADAEGTRRCGGWGKLLEDPACVAKRGVGAPEGACVAVHAVPCLGVVLEQLGED